MIEIANDSLRYLLAFVASQLPPFLYRLNNFIAPDKPIYVLELGQVVIVINYYIQI
jgi:hypothetical protein